jgi:peptide/nickel transport system substrate-binding protein
MKPDSRRKTVGLAALLVLAALLCAGVQAATATENTMTMSIGGYENTGTDPTLDSTIWPDIGGWQEQHFYTHLSPLITLDGDGNVVPWMAESYDVSDDCKTITFHLRKGVKFADGTLLNASILKFNFDRMITFGWNDMLINRSNTQIGKCYDYSEALDENTFKIHFTKGWLEMPFEITTSDFFDLFISPLDVTPAWDIRGMLKPEKKYNGLGPYYLDENESIPKQKIVLIKRHSWRDDYNFHKPMLDKIVLTYIADPQTAVMALEKGDIDYICRVWNAPLDALPKLEKNSDITIETDPEVRMYLLRTAYWKEPFKGPDGILLRKAICYALNRTEMVEGAFNGYAVPATDSMYLSPQRPDVPECCNKGYDYDLEKAKQILNESGWRDSDGDGILDKNGKSLKGLDLVVSSTSSLSWQKDLALVVQSQLMKIGIDVQVQTLEKSAYQQARNEGNYDLMMQFGFGRCNPLSQELGVFNYKTGFLSNYYENQNETLKTIVGDIQTADNEQERDNNVCQVCNILYDEAGVIPLVYQMQYAVMSSKVKGFEFGPSSSVHKLDHVEDCWIEK